MSHKFLIKLNNNLYRKRGTAHMSHESRTLINCTNPCSGLSLDLSIILDKITDDFLFAHIVQSNSTGKHFRHQIINLMI